MKCVALILVFFDEHFEIRIFIHLNNYRLIDLETVVIVIFGPSRREYDVTITVSTLVLRKYCS